MRSITPPAVRVGLNSGVALAVLVGAMAMGGEAHASHQTSCVTHITDDLGRVHEHNWCNIKNVKYVGIKQGKTAVALAKGRGPITLTLTNSETVSNTKSSTITVTAGSVSTAVGFDVTKSRTKTMAASWAVPRGKMGTLKAYPLYKTYTFKAYSKLDGSYVGKGTARQAVGYAYTHSAS
ncbi:hypothetical protein ACFV06_29405 [Streptomyces sp. NPDC059618]|uniref:hypothetical protein n=1 Tax=Streptomyces sp. NPDC059618 TaxID=3346887 RepID=UPI00369B73CD